eukprot:gnl/TRDRNA2_/TRDRNA2_184986_c0_seq1.p1 gnl/TRDRNA2_/TRDRNA2_184986_c0~~gnl/TRDRNA2_/TRDRNA2_184986_c0_seq1.p1  ORF type:complete len:304 (-),score=43.68 gnl/TRDRNA2_/TRDRNA2_184986_c0_seq1:112-1023(-)
MRQQLAFIFIALALVRTGHSLTQNFAVFMPALRDRDQGSARQAGFPKDKPQITYPLKMGQGVVTESASKTSKDKYPFDPLLDEDYIYDDNNYLEDYQKGLKNATASPKVKAVAPAAAAAPKKKVPPSPTTAVPTAKATSAPTSTEAPTKAAAPTSTEAPTTAEAPTSTEAPTTAAATPSPTTAAATQARLPGAFTKPPTALLPTCVTRRDPRTDEGAGGLYTASAPHGTPCLFGVHEQDEGSHCIFDGGRFGTFGWCYTTSSKTQWGSCADHCPLWGGAKAIVKQVDLLSKKVQHALERLDRL